MDFRSEREYVYGNIVPTVNIAEEFYAKLTLLINNKSIRLCVKDDAFKKFGKAVNDKVNIVITTYSKASKYLGDLIEEYYDRKQRLVNFLVIDEAHLLLNHISLIEITKEFDKVALISAQLCMILSISLVLRII